MAFLPINLSSFSLFGGKGSAPIRSHRAPKGYRAAKAYEGRHRYSPIRGLFMNPGKSGRTRAGYRPTLFKDGGFFVSPGGRTQAKYEPSAYKRSRGFDWFT